MKARDYQGDHTVILCYVCAQCQENMIERKKKGEYEVPTEIFIWVFPH